MKDIGYPNVAHLEEAAFTGWAEAGMPIEDCKTSEVGAALRRREVLRPPRHRPAAATAATP
jgi:hypothetical protein